MKQRNPNSYNSARRNSSKFWSELPEDLLTSVLERLGFAESRRAESVCKSWYSAARRCVAKKQIPWLILFPEEGDRLNNHWCTLFNPEEKGKLYRIRDDGFEFAYSYCLATYGHWLFMGDRWYNFYILNLFTRERIDLPHLESQLGTTKLERNRKGMFCFSNGDQQRTYQGVTIQSPVFWIDEQTKDYIVIWGFGEWCVVYSKKGDHFWNQIQIPKVSYETNMVYKDHKLYYIMHDYFGTSGFVKIFDFSREIPQEIFQCPVPATGYSILLPTINSWKFNASKLVVTVTGDVLKVEKWVKVVNPVNIFFSFRVYNVFNNYEKVDSLGHEAMLFDLGITVLANDDDDIVGFKRNSIYFMLFFTRRTLLKFVSSISRHRRWSHYTSLIVRPSYNSPKLDGSYQVSSRHNSDELCRYLFFSLLKSSAINITTAIVCLMTSLIIIMWNIKYIKNLFWLFGKIFSFNTFLIGIFLLH